MKHTLLGLIFTFILLPKVNAECNMSFKYGVIVDPLHIRILKEELTYIQITRNVQLFISGREINLNTNQKELLSEYSIQLRQQVPEIVSIATKGVDVGLEAVNRAIGGSIGEESESHRVFQKRFNEMQWNLRNRFNSYEESYFIAAQNFNDFDQIFSGQFKKEIEHIVTQSLGSILMAVGDAMVERTKRKKDQKTNTEEIMLDEEMTNLEKELLLALNTQTSALDIKAKAFCENLQFLNNLENKIRQSIPTLATLNLINREVPVKP